MKKSVVGPLEPPPQMESDLDGVRAYEAIRLALPGKEDRQGTAGPGLRWYTCNHALNGLESGAIETLTVARRASGCGGDGPRPFPRLSGKTIY